MPGFPNRGGALGGALQDRRLVYPELRAHCRGAWRSFLRRHGGTPGDILRELNEAVHLAPNNWIYRTALGEVYQEQGQSVRAIQVYSEALSLAPDQGSVYFQRGLAYKAIGEFSLGHLMRPGLLYLEINEKYGDDVKSLLLGQGFERVDVLKDLNNKDRFIRAEVKMTMLDTSYWNVEH